jgi:hypothetical protein
MMSKLFSYLCVACLVLVLFSCQKEYSVDTYSGVNAQGSLWDSTGNCLPETVHGTFYDGITPGPDTAYVEVQVNVTQTGTYSITSDLQNGFQFFDSGFFSNTGLNVIRLKPLGTPIIPVSSTFTINFDSSSCSFVVNVQDSTGTGLGGHDTTGTGDTTANWQFTTGDGTFSGSIDTAFITVDTSIWRTGGNMLFIEGFTSTRDTVFHIITYLPTNVITTGSYSTQAVPPENAAIFGFNLVSNGAPIYDGIPDSSSASNVTFIITSYDNSTHILEGTFSGTANNSSGDAVVSVTNGSFVAKVSP